MFITLILEALKRRLAGRSPRQQALSVVERLPDNIRQDIGWPATVDQTSEFMIDRIKNIRLIDVSDTRIAKTCHRPQPERRMP